jgi:FAD/FMN-containing dehydrogenase
MSVSISWNVVAAGPASILSPPGVVSGVRDAPRAVGIVVGSCTSRIRARSSTETRAARVLEAFGEITAAAPDALTVWLDLLRFPGAEPLVAVDVTYLGPAMDAQALLRPFDAIDGLLSDSRRVLPVADLGSITAEPTDPGPSLSRSALLTGLDEDTAKALLATPLDPLLGVQVRHLSGAFTRPSGTPFGPLTEPYYLYALGIPTTQERAAAITDRLDELIDSLGTAVSHRKPLTALTRGETVADTFAPDVLARLRDVKRRRDPNGLFRSNYPVLGQ